MFKKIFSRGLGRLKGKPKMELIEKHIEDKDQHNVPDGVNKTLCDGCTKCCEHVAIQLDTPEDEDDYDNIVWYVLHKNVFVFIDDEGDWYVEFRTPCEALTPDGLCAIHTMRPEVCVNYGQDSCERYAEGSPYKVLFDTRDALIDWVRKNTKYHNFGS